jgi:hypothetical protein
MTKLVYRVTGRPGAQALCTFLDAVSEFFVAQDECMSQDLVVLQTGSGIGNSMTPAPNFLLPDESILPDQFHNT